MCSVHSWLPSYSFQFVHEKEIMAEDDQVFLMKLQVGSYITGSFSGIQCAKMLTIAFKPYDTYITIIYLHFYYICISLVCLR